MENITIFFTPLKEMMVRIAEFLPIFLIAILILIVGSFLTQVITKFIVQVLKLVHFDKFSEHIGLEKFLKTGGIKDKPSELVGCISYWVMMIAVVITTVKAFGLVMASYLIDTVLSYIPSVVSAVVVLMVGMVIARFVAAVMYLMAKNTQMPAPVLLARITKLAILAYVTIIFLKEIGLVSVFVGPHYTILIGGLVFAVALAFGLAGKDVASKYLGFLKKPDD